ncbi:MAG: hypothetical protein NVS3B10_07300 [Polyangiales bacterium]
MRTFSSFASLGIVSLLFAGCGATKSPDTGDCLGSDCPGGGGGDRGVTGDAPSGLFDVGGGDGGGDGGLVFQDITLTPTNATIYIDTATTPPTAAKQPYTATLNITGGGTKDVTSAIKLTLEDPSLGTFAGPLFTSATKLPGTALGVTTVVHGTAEAKQGSANLTIVALRKTGDHRDFFFVVPYLGPPTPDRDVLKFGTNIKQVDVAFTQDTTGSMSGSITGVISTMTSTIMPGLKAAIPSVGIAVVDHKDSDDGDPWVAKVLNVVNIDPAVSVASYSGMSATGGVDFRAGSLAVVVNITDAHWHDGGDPDSSINSWNGVAGNYMDMTRLTAAFKAGNAKFVGIEDQHFASYETTPYAFDHQPQVLSDATGSNIPPGAFGGKCGAGQCCTKQGGAPRAPDAPGGNCRLVFDIMDGAGIDASLVAAIQAISVGSTFDVTAVAANDPSNADAVDATKFIKALRAMDEGSAKAPDACPPHAAKDTNGDGIKDTFIAVVVGTPVCFEILPQENTTVHPKTVAQFFNAFIDVLGMPGSVKLDRRNVLFLVPPKEPAAK